MAGRKQAKATGVTSADKEDHPPKKSTTCTVSVAGLFANKHLQRRASENEARHLFDPRPAGIVKAGPANSRFGSQLRRSKKAENHPLVRSFADTADGYRKGVLHCVEEQLEPVCKDLLARVEGLSVRGQPLAASNSLSAADIEDFVARESQLSKPLEEETIAIQSRKKDGTSEAVNIKLGTMLRHFENLLEKTQVEVNTLRKQVREVDLEIAEAYQDAVNTERCEGKKARRELEKDLEALANEAQEAKQQTLADIKQVREAEKLSADEEKRKLNALLNSQS